MSRLDVPRPRDEVMRLHDAFKELHQSTIKNVLESWIDRKPIEERLDILEKVLSDFGSLKETADNILKYLRERDWRGCIVAVTGDYGSGKTQMGFMLLRMIREKGEADARMITLEPTVEVRKCFLEELGSGIKPTVLIVDEVDQLMIDMRRGRREAIEELADLTRMIAEGSYSNPARGSVILLLSNKAYSEIKNDRALENRLMARARTYSLSMNENQRIRASLEALKKLIALSMSYNYDYYLKIHLNFDLIYQCLEKLALELSETHEIGGVVKYLAEALLEGILPSSLKPRALGPIEEGKFFEDLMKRVLRDEVGSIQIRVTLGDEPMDYLARFSEEPLSVPGARTDAHYEIWTYDSKKGMKGNFMVGRVGVEVKYGRYEEYWKMRKDQLLRIMEDHPLLLILISDIDQDKQDEITDLKLEMRAGGRAFEVVSVDSRFLRVTEIMDESSALRFVSRWMNLERDLNEALRIILTQSMRAEREVSEQELLSQVSSSIVTSLLRELRKARTSKRISTLSGLIESAVQGVYRSYNKAPLKLTESFTYRILRIMEREGLGRISETGKSFNLDGNAKRRVEELYSEEARRKIERVVLDELLRYRGHESKPSSLEVEF